MEREKYVLNIADIIFNIDTYPDEYIRQMFAPYVTENSDVENAFNISQSTSLVVGRLPTTIYQHSSA